MYKHFPVPIYLLFKGDEGLKRNDVIVRIAGYAGKDTEKMGKLPEKSSDFHWCNALSSISSEKRRGASLGIEQERVNIATKNYLMFRT